MSDHMATQKREFSTCLPKQTKKTHQPSVKNLRRRVSVYSKPVPYETMSKQKQAEQCVLYIRVSSTRQAEDGVSIEAQIARGKLHAQYMNFLLPDENIFIDEGVSATTRCGQDLPVSRCGSTLPSRRLSRLLRIEWTDYSEELWIVLLRLKNWTMKA
jgi:hypothetical protein